MQTSQRPFLLIIGLALGLAGCGGAEPVSHPNVVPAAGSVVYNGAPVGGAAVIFMSPDTAKSGWICAGQTDRSGKFEITSIFAPGTESKGIPPGSYTAVVTKFEAASTPKPAHQQQPAMAQPAGAVPPGGAAPPASAGPKSVIPLKYASDQTSDLKFNIDKAGNASLELKLAD